MKNRVTSLACKSSWEAVLAAPNAVKKWGRKNMVEMTRKVAGEACMAIFQPTPGFKRRMFHSSGFSTEGTSIFASTVCEVSDAFEPSQHKGLYQG